MIQVPVLEVNARYGLRGVRVGEASNPGPVQTRQARRSQTLIPVAQVDVSSEEEVLVRPNRGRHVVPRIHGEVPATVPASSDALLAAGLLCEFPAVATPRVLTSCTAREPESTAPASPSALVEAGRAVNVPPTILDALEEDLCDRFSPSVRVEVASNWRESNDRVAEVASLTLSRGGVEAPHQFDMTVADSEDEHRDPTPTETPIEVPFEEATTESLGSGASEADPDAEDEFADVPLPEAELPVVEFTITREFRAALQSLDDLNLVEVFSRRPSGMRTVPKFMRGGFRNALRVAIQEALSVDERRSERGWKLLLMLPRMLLFKPPRKGTVAKEKLMARLEMFRAGRWEQLLADSRQCAEQAGQVLSRRSRRGGPTTAQRADRALHLVQLGELSSARQALEGAEIAPGDRNTLAALQDPVRRPAIPRDPLPEDLLTHVPARVFELDKGMFSKNLRSARRGAAAGPSGMTVEHLQPLLDHPRALHSMFLLAERMARADVPPSHRGCSPARKTHSPQKAKRRSEGHCRRRCHPESGGSHPRSTIGTCSGGGHRTFPIRALHQGRL